MAKSIRSKHRRKMRNIKREHFAKKDLERLKKVVANSEAYEIDNVVTMKSAEEVKESLPGKSDDSMDVDKKPHHKKTFLDENGQYPQWMNRRAQKKQKAKNIKTK